jgi:serine protease AprX
MERRNIMRILVTAVALIVPGLFAVGPSGASGAPSPASGGAVATYIVQAGASQRAAAAVTSVGGTVVTALDIIGAVDARLDTQQAAQLSAISSVVVTPDLALKPVGHDYPSASSDPAGSNKAVSDLAVASASQLALIGVQGSATAGSGVAVALVDTGVAKTAGLTKVVRSPDFSGEGNTLDGYGHGTFIAGLIAGNGKGNASGNETGGVNGSAPGVSGVAPAATLVSVKVAGTDGSTTIGRVIAGIGWTVVHRDDYGIKVLNLAFGANLNLDPARNPLDAAVEAAWAAGITVVTAAGNGGAGTVTSPGDDPWVITVGASTMTAPVSAATWSGTSASKPDVYAPGVSVISLRAPGSTIDRENPSARVGSGYFRGTGTSMATGLAAGAAVLLVQAHPAATPDDIKGALLAGSGRAFSGHAGLLNVPRAVDAQASPSWWQHHPVAFDGLGAHIDVTMPWAMAQRANEGGGGDQGNVEARTVDQQKANPARNDRASNDRASNDHANNGPGSSDSNGNVEPTTASWTTASWTSASWTSASWTSASWTSASWTSASWTSASWTSASWTSASWTSASWTSASWTSASWTSASWTSASWTAQRWS